LPADRDPRSGVTLIEILVAVTLLSLLSLGVLVAMRLGLTTMDKTDARIVSNRRVIGARRILENEIDGFMYAQAIYQPQPLQQMPVMFLEAQPQRLRFVSSYSLEEASRGRPRIVVLEVIPGERGEGVRLILNEVLYTGPYQTGQMITAIERVVGSPNPVVHFSDSPASPQSFVLADRLAYCRFSYLEARPVPPLRLWRPDWVDPAHLPLGVRVDMASLDAPGADLHQTTLTLPLMVSRQPGGDYADQ
jgi:prepilin-type N-terminal cleavage/methylation domain-containing protein